MFGFISVAITYPECLKTSGFSRICLHWRGNCLSEQRWWACFPKLNFSWTIINAGITCVRKKWASRHWCCILHMLLSLLHDLSFIVMPYNWFIGDVDLLRSFPPTCPPLPSPPLTSVQSHCSGSRPCLIYQYFNMDLKLSGQNCNFLSLFCLTVLKRATG